MMSGPFAVIGEALWATVALLALVAGCAADGSWWSLLTASCYLLALGVWVLFRPGCMPCVAAPGMNTSLSSGAGCCGGKLWSLWGAWLTSFLGSSTFGLAFSLFHNEAVRAADPVPAASSMLLASDTGVVLAVACGRFKHSVSSPAWSRDSWLWRLWCGRSGKQKRQHHNHDIVAAADERLLQTNDAVRVQ